MPSGSEVATTTRLDGRPPQLTLRTFGAFALQGADGRVLLGPSKPLALVTYLHALPGRATLRDHLLHVLWGDVNESRARHALRQTIWHLRRHLGDDAFDVGVGTVALGVAIQSDFEEFLQNVENARLANAVALYRGEFLAWLRAAGRARI